MPLDVRACPPGERGRIRVLLADPSLSREYGTLAAPDAFDVFMNDPFLHGEGMLLGLIDGEVVGFAASFLVEGHDGMFAFTRVGVIERGRRQGLGRALIEASRRILQADVGARLREHCLGAWVPSPEAEAFAGALGFVPERTYWRMERPLQPVAGPGWPSDVDVTTLDPASERALADWNDAYNRSFADHHHFVRSTVDDLRKVFASSTFDPSGLRLVHRSGRCVGFCRSTITDGSGEIASVGVTPDARGVGLGRALLRDGVDWLQQKGSSRVELLVDGENESALRLYRSEGFEVFRTRRVWSYWLGPRATSAR